VETQTGLESLRQEVEKITRGIESQSDFIQRALSECSSVAVEGEFLFATDFDDSAKLLRMRLSEAWWKMHTQVETLEQVARRCEKELAGAIERLPEPDRSDESWEAHHAEYLEKMDAYNQAQEEANRLFIEWRAYYAKYIKPYRDRELAENADN